MMYELFVYSIILGLLFGGSIKQLWNIELQGFPLVLSSAISLGLANWMRRSSSLPTIINFSMIERISGIIYFLAFLFLIIFALKNREERLLLFVGLGIACNMLVIFTNGAQMPVDPSLAQSMGLMDKITYLDANGFYTLADAQTNFYYLADIIKNPFLSSYIVSIGDFFISGGLFLFVLQKMKIKQLKIKEK